MTLTNRPQSLWDLADAEKADAEVFKNFWNTLHPDHQMVDGRWQPTHPLANGDYAIDVNTWIAGALIWVDTLDEFRVGKAIKSAVTQGDIPNHYGKLLFRYWAHSKISNKRLADIWNYRAYTANPVGVGSLWYDANKSAMWTPPQQPEWWDASWLEEAVAVSEWTASSKQTVTV